MQSLIPPSITGSQKWKEQSRPAGNILINTDTIWMNFLQRKIRRRFPHLNVCYTDELAAAAVMIPEPLNYTWTYEADDGENRTITTSAAYSLFQSDPVEVKKLSEPMTMELQFSKKP